LATLTANAKDIRNEDIKNSKMVQAILSGLKLEQRLSCKIAIEEDGNESVAYFVENNLSKFSAAFLCNDGRSAVITGVIGDGGQTKNESFKLIFAN
jgi:hypothetical protein